MNDKLHHQLYMMGESEDEEVRPDEVLNVTIPSTKDWEEFWQKVDTLKVWSWGKTLLVKFVMALCGN